MTSDPLVHLVDAVVFANGFPLLSGVDLDVAPGTLNVVTGANGAGKTSLLRLLAGLVPLSSGEGSVCGIDLARGDLRQLRRRVGWLGHEGSFYADLSVAENLRFCATALDRPISQIDVVLERVGLRARANTITKQLSAGQRRRLGLAWLLLRRAELWLLDEPYASLDDQGREFFDDLLADVTGAGATVLVSAHDPLRSVRLNVASIHLAGGRVQRDRP
ncbi:MAG TPA: heme ABC exporter ATP-binding protein CcmA [Acidimicrobiales bacterium]|jgi:heme ABC exporter ATP-binding subunit CcmA